MNTAEAAPKPLTRTELLAERRDSALSAYEAIWAQMPRTREGNITVELRTEVRKTLDSRRAATTKII